MSVNRGSTIFGLAFWILTPLCIGIDPLSMYRLPVWAKMLVRILLPPHKNECQSSVNNCWSCLLDNLRAMIWHKCIINLSAAYIGKNGSDNIVPASYNSAPRECQQSMWKLSTLHSNELHCIVPTLSFTRSVFSICPCIQHHKYACNVSQIWLFLLLSLLSMFKNPHCT